MTTRNLILQDSPQMPYFTNMRLVFDAFAGVCAEHDWFISDLECHIVDTLAGEPLDERLLNGDVLIDGRKLERILRSSEIQFDWAVFSALKRGDQPLMKDPPFADGNPDFWRGSPKPQLSNAEFEIVCWDDTCVLLIGLSQDMADTFRASFPEAVDLDDQNRTRQHVAR